MMPNTRNDAISNTENIEINRALTYSEMMNEGRQKIQPGTRKQGDGLQQRVEELERKMEHLQNVIQRQIRLGRMTE